MVLALYTILASWQFTVYTVWSICVFLYVFFKSDIFYLGNVKIH